MCQPAAGLLLACAPKKHICELIYPFTFSMVFTFLYSQKQVWQKLESYIPICIPDLPNLANTNSRLAQLSPSGILQVDAKKRRYLVDMIDYCSSVRGR